MSPSYQHAGRVAVRHQRRWLTIVVLMNYSGSMVSVFTFIILISTSAYLVMYLFCSLAACKLALRGDMGVQGRKLIWLLAVATLGALYSAWTLWGAGKEAFVWGMGLFALGLPLYFLMKWWQRRAAVAAVARCLRHKVRSSCAFPMPRDPRYDILFEPVKIGPVTAKNRFYQVPHCNGMGWRDAEGLAAMRGMKAEGGWGVVCTEYCSIHPTSATFRPIVELASGTISDIPALALMSRCRARAWRARRVELWHGGFDATNLLPREVPLGAVAPADQSSTAGAGARDGQGATSATFAAGTRGGAARAAAGFDIVYVYAGHDYRCRALPVSAAQPAHRRVWRLPREPHATAARNDRGHAEAVGDSCAVARALRGRRAAWAPRHHATARRARSWRCSANCPISGTSMSRAWAMIRRPRASPTKAARSRTSPSSSS